jgi:hypothetical protein
VTRFELHFHGVRVLIEGAPASVLSHFRHDFHYFLRKPSRARPDLKLRFRSKPPKWGKSRKVGRAELYFSKSGERRLKYFGSTWVEYRPEAGEAWIFGADDAHLYESALSVVLSFAGEWLDRQGVHRVHGLGVSSEGEGALFLAPSGMGKSTLALGLLKETSLDLLSDDTPLLNGAGEMLSFPQRIATREKPEGFEAKHLRKFKRARYGEKFVLGAEAFSGRIEERVGVDKVIVTARGKGRAPALATMARWKLVWPLAKWLVLGFETPQMWELFLRPSPADFGRKAAILRSRLRVAAGLLKRAKAYRLELGEDRLANARLVEKFLEGRT